MRTGNSRIWSAKENRQHATCHQLFELNKCLKQKSTHCLPSRSTPKYQEFSRMIDPNMGYLSILLTKEAKKLLTISTPFRYYNCEELTMGVIPAADIFQTWMVGSSQPMRPDLYINIILHDKGESPREHPIGLDDILKH